MDGIRIFYSSPLLCDSDLSSIRVKVLLTLTLGSRIHIHPESWIICKYFIKCLAHHSHTVFDILEFHVSPIILKSFNIDLILRMDWLKTHTASIDCASKTVQLLHPLDEIVDY